MDKKELEIRLLENSFEFSKSNYHLHITIYLAAIALIFMITPIMIEIFPKNKIAVLVGGIISYVIFSVIFGSKLYYEMRKTNVKYDQLTKRFRKLGVDTEKISKEFNKLYNELPYRIWIRNLIRKH
ncbi:MAG: hypothetical protein AABX83_03960 [Nanoarchaeota archaeon]